MKRVLVLIISAILLFESTCYAEWVNGHIRSGGWVNGYRRTKADGILENNLSYKGPNRYEYGFTTNQEMSLRAALSGLATGYKIKRPEEDYFNSTFNLDKTPTNYKLRVIDEPKLRDIIQENEDYTPRFFNNKNKYLYALKDDNLIAVIGDNINITGAFEDNSIQCVWLRINRKNIANYTQIGSFTFSWDTADYSAGEYLLQLLAFKNGNSYILNTYTVILLKKNVAYLKAKDLIVSISFSSKYNVKQVLWYIDNTLVNNEETNVSLTYKLDGSEKSIYAKISTSAGVVFTDTINL